MTSQDAAGFTYAERMETHRQQIEWRRERIKRNIFIAIQTAGFAICVSTYIGVSITALGSAFIKSPSSKVTMASAEQTKVQER